ncbi:MAG: hypothetical protein ABIF82_09950 [Planctomycetota bacterium]
MSAAQTLYETLEKIRISRRGVLKPAHVVAEARDPSSPLHKRFCWDDTKAAHRYRLWQARELIAVVVQRFSADHKPVRAYVSLQDDRGTLGGGYREIRDVMSCAQTRKRLLAEALNDLRIWEERYRLLKELAPIIRAAARLRDRCKG